MHIQFAELPVFNQPRAKAFYVEHLGCEVAADAPMGPSDWHWVELSFPGAQTNLHFLHRADEQPSDEPVMVIIDEKLVATIEAMRVKGVEIITEPREAPWAPGRTIAEFRDSEGNRMILADR